MKKPLRGESDELYRYLFGISAAEFSVRAANKYLGNRNFKGEDRLPNDYPLCITFAEWMGRLVDEGVTSRMIDDLNGVLKGAQFRCILSSRRGESLPFMQYSHVRSKSSPPEIDAVYHFSEQLTAGGFVGLKRCGLPKCRRFFIGPPNATWCSDSCGAKFRVAKMRKKAKLRKAAYSL